MNGTDLTLGEWMKSDTDEESASLVQTVEEATGVVDATIASE